MQSRAGEYVPDRGLIKRLQPAAAPWIMRAAAAEPRSLIWLTDEEVSLNASNDIDRVAVHYPMLHVVVA